MDHGPQLGRSRMRINESWDSPKGPCQRLLSPGLEAHFALSPARDCILPPAWCPQSAHDFECRAADQPSDKDSCYTCTEHDLGIAAPYTPGPSVDHGWHQEAKDWNRKALVCFFNVLSSCTRFYLEKGYYIVAKEYVNCTLEKYIDLYTQNFLKE